MDDATGEAEGSGLRVAFDRRLKLEFHGATVTSDAGLLAFRELDDALGLTALAAEVLADPRTGRNGRHSLIAQLRQSVFGRLAGYEDVNDAERLGRDPAMRWIVGGRAVTEQAASTSQMGRFETSAMTSPTNLTELPCSRIAPSSDRLCRSPRGNPRTSHRDSDIGVLLRSRDPGQHHGLWLARARRIHVDGAVASSSVHTRKLSRVFGPNVVAIATSVASRPRAMSTRPMRGTLFRGSNVCHAPPR
jgi:hypothetical protein